MAARAALARLLWSADGTRRVPSRATLDAALTRNTRADLEWIFEWNPLGPLYFLPTREWITTLAREVRRLGARRVLEVGAGDGTLARALARALPEAEVFASDSGDWESPEGRLSAAERRQIARLPAGLALGADVLRLEVRAAIRRVQPDLVLCAWVPPGPLIDRAIGAPVRWVLEIGAPGGVCASQWTWRFAHDFLEGPIESQGRCRLDLRPAQATHTRVTLYFGRAHPDYAVERVSPGHWLWQFKPAATTAVTRRTPGRARRAPRAR